jgi:mannose-6-phosphate isomerase-like protein (cupin superfamily)
VRHAQDVLERRVGNDAMAVREIVDASVGCAPFTVALLRVVRGRSFERRTGADEELLFVLGGSGHAIAGGHDVELEPETGVMLGPGAHYELENERDEDLVIVAVALHDPQAAGAASEPQPRVSRLAEAADQRATGERTFRIVFDPQSGCATATQFVGAIPVGAAPRHYHLYEEVLYVLDGDGVMHMNDAQAPVHPGSVIHLPPRKPHTLENSGPGVMRVLGVFRPAGSPAAAFYPDGTPAYTAEEPQAAAAAQ